MQELSQVNRRIWITGLAVACLMLHWVVAVLLPPRFAPWSTLYVVLAELAAIGVCFRAVHKTQGPVRMLWWLLALSTLLHAVAMSMDLRMEILGMTEPNPLPGLSVLFSTFYCVPLLVAVSMQFDGRIQRPIRIVNMVLAIAMGTVFYVLVFSRVSLQGSSRSEDAFFFIRLFDALDLFLAIAATIRAFGAEELQERFFFYVAAVFLWANTVFPAVHNRILIRHDFVWLDLLISAPYLLLTVLIVQAPPDGIRRPRPSSRFNYMVRGGSPIFLSLGLLLLGLVVSRAHFRIGVAAVLLAVACDGAVNVLAQSRSLDAEELLLAEKKGLEELVGVDALTQIGNRRAFDERIGLVCHDARRSGRPVSLLMIDLDYFKQLNDASGHLQGDAYLIRVANALQETLSRANDFVARYGGEEFSVLLPLTGGPGAAMVAKKLHAAIASLGLEHPGSPLGRLTISIGVATSPGEGTAYPLALIREADQALYRAKTLGRSRTEAVVMEDQGDVRQISAD